ncbi:MAG: hypothetical protein LM583_06590 [Desulfurococcaceae archaeon]|nr:hypothetical protein [Desulfurococcaceae archaeon]
MGFLKEVLTKILKKSNTIDREEMKAIYRVLLEIRRELVDAFYIIAERKLRELYDGFSMTMLKLDKTIQVLRRALGEPVNTTYTRLKKAELEEELKKLSPELSQVLRTLIYSTELLKEFAQSMPYYYLRAVVKSIDDNVDRAIKALGEVT